MRLGERAQACTNKHTVGLRAGYLPRKTYVAALIYSPCLFAADTYMSPEALTPEADKGRCSVCFIRLTIYQETCRRRKV